MSTTHKLSIDNSGALMLRDALSGHSWYKGQKINVVVNAAELADSMSELNAPEITEQEREDAKLGKPTFRDRVKAWSRQAYEIEISEKQREAAKVCVRKNLEEGTFPATIHVVKILKTLGIED